MTLETLKKGTYPGGVLVAHALASAGISHTFGIPGTHNIELYDALAQSNVKPVLVTDEQSAGFMADGMSRSGGGIGCANVVPGAGITHVMSGVAEAYMDNVPMLVLTCGIRTDMDLKYQLHDIDQLAVIGPVCKKTWQVTVGEDIPYILLEAVALAIAGCPGPVSVAIPVNLYMFTFAWDPKRYESWKSQRQQDAVNAPPVASKDQIATVANMLQQAKKPLLHVGLGAADCSELVVALAEKTGAVVSTTFSGQGAMPEDHPQWLWPGFGNACPPALKKIADGCDATLIVGARMGEISTGSYGVTVKSPSAQVDIEPSVLSANFPVDHEICSEARLFLEALLSALGDMSRDTSKLTEELKNAHQTVAKQQAKSGDSSRVSPHTMFSEVQKHFPKNTVYTTDSGKGTFLAMEHLRVPGPRLVLSPTDFSCMGYAIPGALGAAFGDLSRPVVAFAGDGALLMTGLELITAAQHQLKLAMFVLSDGELGQIASFQRTLTNDAPCSVLPDYNLKAFAEVASVPYLEWNADSDIESVMKKTMDHLENGPVVIKVTIDYSQKTFFTKGVVKTNFGRLPWKDRLRMVGRAVRRRLPV